MQYQCENIIINENNLLNCLLEIISNRQFFIIVDKTVADLYAEKIISKLPSNNSYIYVLESTEKNKNLNTVSKIVDKLAELAFGRDTLLIAIGGGIVGDIAGFVASIYMRGIEHIQVPTTLLAQVDACLGGKTGVNHKLGKNLIGTFYPAKQIIINDNFLETLSDRQYINGLGEVIKYAASLDYNFFEYLEKNKKALVARDCKVLMAVINKCISIKKKLVSEDFFDNEKRTVLNFGHTLGHAIEILFQDFLHGEAIALGMLAINNISCSDVRLNNLISDVGLPVKLPQTLSSECIDKLYNLLLRDKKRLSSHSNNEFKVVLLDSLGKSYIDIIDKNTILRAISAIK